MTHRRLWYSCPTQVYWTCKALVDGREINHRTEIREARGWRLAAIVHRLKSEYGWPILTDHRGPDAVAYYRLAPGADLARLRFPPSAKALAPEVQA